MSERCSLWRKVHPNEEEEEERRSKGQIFSLLQSAVGGGNVLYNIDRWTRVSDVTVFEPVSSDVNVSLDLERYDDESSHHMIRYDQSGDSYIL